MNSAAPGRRITARSSEYGEEHVRRLVLLRILRDVGAILHHSANYHPRALLGDHNWSDEWPFNGNVFGGMQRGIAREAERLSARRRAAGGA